MELCLFGAASDAVQMVYITESEFLGERLAARGHGLIFGGGATGMMGAAARGAHRGGGRIIGVAPRFFDEPGVLTPLCTELIFTETMDERKGIMESRADGFIIAPGGIGTLDEVFSVLCAKSCNQAKGAVLFYNTLGFWDPALKMLQDMRSRGFIRSDMDGAYTVCQTPEDALRALGL